MKPVAQSETILRAAAILTTSYVAATVIPLQNKNQAVVEIDFTIGSLTDGRVKLEFSNDGGVTYYQETFLDSNNGTLTGNTQANPLRLHEYILGSTGAYRIPVRMCDKLMKVSVKGTGTVTSSSIAVKVVDGVA